MWEVSSRSYQRRPFFTGARLSFFKTTVVVLTIYLPLHQTLFYSPDTLLEEPESDYLAIKKGV
jgi:hypothetical protein